MLTLIVSDTLFDWGLEIPETETVSAWDYLTDASFARRRNVKLFNLCRSVSYQSVGYYVSLLAEARGHRPVPGVIALQDIKSQSTIRFVEDELDSLIQKSLKTLESNHFELSIYFGKNVAKRYDKLARELFNLVQIPLMRVHFQKGESWELRRITILGTADIPRSHRDFLVSTATDYFNRTWTRKKKKRMRYDMAILYDPAEQDNSPSDEGALKKFIKAAEEAGVNAELITKEDAGRLLEFDALFIRQTTAMNHYTYRLSRRAANEGLVVIDDPISIARCTNKVYLAELLIHHDISAPDTMIVHRNNVDQVAEALNFPLILKQPDSSFSLGVVKVHDQQELEEQLKLFLTKSELVVAQKYQPTEFDWRIGIIDKRPLFACQYFMAKGHWQIIDQQKAGNGRYGKQNTIPVELVPAGAIKMALKATNLIGDGLYGVDIKESEGKFYLIEVNDNPNIDSGVEDSILKDDLYRRIMETFVKRIDIAKAGK